MELAKIYVDIRPLLFFVTFQIELGVLSITQDMPNLVKVNSYTKIVKQIIILHYNN